MKVKNWQKVIKIGGPKSFLDPCLTILMNTQYLEKPINIINGWFYSVSTIDALSVSNFNKGSTVYSKDCIFMAVSILKLRNSIWARHLRVIWAVTRQVRADCYHHGSSHNCFEHTSTSFWCTLGHPIFPHCKKSSSSTTALYQAAWGVVSGCLVPSAAASITEMMYR